MMATIYANRTALGMKKGRYYAAIRNKLGKLVINLGEGQPLLVLSDSQLAGYGIIEGGAA